MLAMTKIHQDMRQLYHATPWGVDVSDVRTLADESWDAYLATLVNPEDCKHLTAMYHRHASYVDIRHTAKWVVGQLVDSCDENTGRDLAVAAAVFVAFLVCVFVAVQLFVNP